MPIVELDAATRARVHDALAVHVDSGAVPGVAALVAVGDDVHVEVLGSATAGSATLLGRDAIFRIASLTKPVAAAAAMVLVDDGALALHEAVDDVLPELARRQVLRAVDAALDDTVPARRAITLEDLLTLRMGLGSLMAPPDSYPIQRAEDTLGLRTLGPPWPPPPFGADEWMRRLGTLPLVHHPGEQWMYNTGIQVLGVLIERAARRPLEVFLRERLFEPLGMVDTGFSVSARQAPRLTTAYRPDPASGALAVSDPAEGGHWSRPPAFANAAAWLVSTLDDYWAFVQMLRGDGVHRGVRVLSEGAVARMTADHLTAAQRAESTLFLDTDGGWGYGMRVPAATGPAGIPGGFGWDGGSGTTWRTNTATGVTGILFTQREMTSPEPPPTFVDFWTAVYGVGA